MAPAPHFAVVLAGGAGTRFWPRSRLRAPKQLLSIVGGRTMLQETVARLAPAIAARRILVVTAARHAAAVRTQLPALAPDQLIVEPEGKNTAAAIALAALHLAARHPRAVMAVLPADHAIGDGACFRRDLALGLRTAERTGALVTFGIPPTHPETGYGYVRTGSAVPGTRRRVAWVESFIEKPDRRRAEALLARGGVLWNGGIFAWRVDVILAALRRHVPGLVDTLAAARDAGRRGLAAAYRRLPALSVDHGVLERAERVATVRARFDWSDVGSWAAVEPFWRDGGENAVRGRVLPIDSRGCVVDSPKRLVALLGVADLVVVDTPDALLVCRKDRAQDVRLVVDELRTRKLARYL